MEGTFAPIICMYSITMLLFFFFSLRLCLSDVLHAKSKPAVLSEPNPMIIKKFLAVVDVDFSCVSLKIIGCVHIRETVKYAGLII